MIITAIRKLVLNKYIFLIGAAIVLVGILCFSIQSGIGSNNLSQTIAKPIATVLEVKNPSDPQNPVNHTVRKIGHISEYCLLTVLLVTGFYRINLSPIPSTMLSILIPVLTAITDERVIQIHTFGRTGVWKDVMIDSVGMGLGLIIGFQIIRMQKKT